MEFKSNTPQRPARENIVPMINVVFLLLIFFLMTAQITAPVPFEVTPPASDSEAEASGPATLHISAEGALFFDGEDGEAVWPALAGLDPDAPLLIRADHALPATQLAKLLSRLASEGLTNIALVTEGAS